MWKQIRKGPLSLAIGLLALLALTAVACGGGASQKDYDAAKTQLQAKEQEVAQLQTQIKGLAPSAIVQAGQLQPVPPGAVPTGWDTDWSLKLGIKLVATFDSSGEPAWDAAKHPLVYIAPVGPGYAGLLSKTNKLPGVAIIDANTKEVVAYRSYDLGAKDHFEPHGLGVSGNGQFIYLPTGLSSGFGDAGSGRLVVINARTLKLHQVLGTPANPHHAKSFTRNDGKELVLVEDFPFAGAGIYALDPNDNNRVVGGIGPAEVYGRNYLSFAHPDGKTVWIGVINAYQSEGGVAVVDTTTWQVLKNIPIPDSTPIWVHFSGDGKYAYVSGGHESIVAKVDTAKGEVIATTRAGTEGPYGLNLSWDEKLLVTIGKGEGSHNRGITEGLVDPVTMGRPLGTVYTGCLRADHATLHPTPEVNELWIACNSSFEIAVFDLAKRDVTARIPMPNGGSTHGSAFVRYNPDFTGEVVSDQNGLHNAAREKQIELAKAAAAR
jgi:DNA-binding beta-propeller fold protein YncE